MAAFLRAANQYVVPDFKVLDMAPGWPPEKHSILVGIDLPGGRAAFVTRQERLRMTTLESMGLTRRRFIAATTGTLLATASGAAAAGQDASPEAGAATGWSHTDVFGTTVELESRPVRIAANLMTAAALWDLGIEAVAVFDWTASAYPDGDHIGWGNVDPALVENVGDVDGNIQPELLLNAKPDVILTLTYATGDRDQTAGVPPDFWDAINEIAPVVVVTDMGATDVQLERLVAVSESLGADLTTPEVATDRNAYTAKVDEFREAVAGSDLTVLFAYFDAAEFYVGGPAGIAELQFLGSLGLTFANADSAAAGDFWESLSIEQALTYPADVVCSDVYSAYQSLEELQAHEIYGAMPAVAAGQIGLWKRDFPVNYAGVVDFLETILVTFREAEPVS
jgi:iron complex transport system substrate-binding protein